MDKEILSNNTMAGWNKIIGYDMNEIIEGLGYEYYGSMIIGTNNFIKRYKHADKTEGVLSLTPLENPAFIIFQEKKRITEIIFKRKIQVTKYISIPNKEIGVVEYGFDLLNNGYMQFYQEENYHYKYSDPKNPYLVLPDDIKKIESRKPIDIISEVNLWASEIRRSLAPNRNIVVKK